MEEYNLESLEYISSSEVHSMTPLMFLSTIPGPIEGQNSKLYRNIFGLMDNKVSDEQAEEIVQSVTAEQLINQQETQLKCREVSRIYLETINVLTLWAPRVLVPTPSTKGGSKRTPPSISRTRNATNLKPLEGLGVSFKVSKNFKLV